MAYTPVTSDPTQPLDTVDRSTAAAEFRALKSYINGGTTVASSATPDIFNNTNHIINYVGGTPVTGFVAAPIALAERTILTTGAVQFVASANLSIDGTATGNTLVVASGVLLQVIALTTTTFRIIPPAGAVASSSFFANQNFPQF